MIHVDHNNNINIKLLSVGGEGELKTPKSKDALAMVEGKLVAAKVAMHRFCNPESQGRG